MNSLYAAGGLMGCAIAGWLADKVGRKVSIQLITTACILAAAFTTGSQNVAMLLSGRALQGIAAGMINVVCPMYHAEVSPVSVRGRMVGTHATFLVIGYAMASWVGLGCYFESTPAIQWRLCLALQMVAPLLLLLCSSWVPESPRWLIYNGREEQSREILRKLHYHIDDPNGILPEREFMDISRQVAADRENERSFFALFKEPSTRIRMIYGFFIIFAAQSSGVLVINNYQFTLYEGLGITGWKALLLFGVYTSWAATMNWVNALLLDRFGRIKVMTFGMLGAVVAISCDTAMVARFAACYVYASEIFPTWMRAQVIAFSVCELFCGTLIYTGSAPDAFAAVGWKYYLVFVFVPLACVAFIWFVLPETSGLSLEEIGVLFGDHVVVTDILDGELVEVDVGFVSTDFKNLEKSS
ncbi:hypothetical protein BCIN_06g04580 [Botrytis cinerea B05.10]|uniref:Major facilitator superfamily (MFS) profile domain-containing protein n=2 Tax=Botryotinia fuckeliana TaxID=40559 RepID=A0A384JKI5_BOTFB|nr:hypothetical protein BCIN_06g04580 [Botrytis cinerea B05.10]ATZ51002.1 hypothetical protein BCIN_06g04580 [Botrytis cinerea B05.10]EMR87649.1 putative mfs sugar transporter protein [Botrytis cinerea BcDW1]